MKDQHLLRSLLVSMILLEITFMKSYSYLKKLQRFHMMKMRNLLKNSSQSCLRYSNLIYWKRLRILYQASLRRTINMKSSVLIMRLLMKILSQLKTWMNSLTDLSMRFMKRGKKFIWMKITILQLKRFMLNMMLRRFLMLSLKKLQLNIQMMIILLKRFSLMKMIL